MTSYLLQDPRKFCDAFDELTDYIEGEEGWRVAVEELTARKVIVLSFHQAFSIPMCVSGCIYECV